MATLEQIATQIRDLAAYKAPVKTGRLRNRIVAYNNPSKMVKENKKSFTISLNYAPDDAYYGEYWNDPYVRLSGKPEFNYAEKAANDPTVLSMIDLYMENEIDKIMVNDIANKLTAFDEFE